MTAERPPETAARVFQLFTREGSLFVLKFTPRERYQGVEIGMIELVGEAASRGGERVHFAGLGCLPEPSSRVIVAAEPLETQVIQGETVPIYPQETIVRVVELALP